MRNQGILRPKFLRQAAIVAILAGASAACSGGSERFGKPFFTGSTENQKQIIGSADQPLASDAMPAPQEGVARADLPPPGGDGYAPVEGQPMASAAPITGPYAWSAAGGQVVTVRPGDSLDVLAIRHGVPSNQIAIANKISNPGQLTPGKVIVIPVKVAAAEAPAPVTQMARTEPAAPQKNAASHTVVAGDTLYGIARTYGVRPSEIVSLNGLASPEAIRIGQRLTLPGDAPVSEKVRVASANDPGTYGGTKVLGTIPAKTAKDTASEPAATTIAVAKSTDAGSAPEAPAMPKISVEKSAPSFDAATAAVDEATDPPSANGTSFRWPVRGRIISSYGAKPNGEKNDGINLAVPEGTSVKAAESGTVIYAGNELEGYGNLVLIRHTDGWVSAYAHNSAIKVKRGDQVRRGQTVAAAGASGSVSSPQVHFELRKGAKPVNPLDYLAGA